MSQYVKLAAAAALAIGMAFGGTAAQALPYHFQEIGGNPSVLDGQIVVNVEVIAGTQLQFEFVNNVAGGVESSITAIVFQNTAGILNLTAAGLGNIVMTSTPHVGAPNHSGVKFAEGGAPAIPPLTAHYSVSSDPPPVKFGISEQGEFLRIVFDLAHAMDIAAVEAVILAGGLKIGLHVQSIGGEGGYSEKFVNMPSAIPLPAGLVLFLSGLLGICVLGRYKAKQRKSATA